MTDTRTIPLSRGYVATVDTDDYDWLSMFKWSALVVKGNAYAVRLRKGRTLYMHRDIVRCESHLNVVHDNRDSLDNRRGNLVPMTASQRAKWVVAQ